MVTYAPDAVQVNFTYSPLLGYKGEPIQFSDLSGNTAINDPCTYEWDWGDGSAHAYTKNATHTYFSVGNYPVTHKVTGSKNLSTGSKALVVAVGSKDVAPLTCNPAGGDATGIVDISAPYGEKYSPTGSCVQPYQCMCVDGAYAKYRCDPSTGIPGAGGSYPGSTLISINHPDCCKFCGVNTSAPGDAPTVLLPSPNFSVVDITVTPSSCNAGELVTAIAHVTNTGNAAGTAKVVFYWDDGTSLDLPRTTDVINVNTTVPTPPAVGQAPSEGTRKLCAMLV